MDAARLGGRPAVPRAFLEAAAPGYLTDTEWDMLPADWLEQALTDTAKPAMGVRGPLAPIRPRPGPGVPDGPGGGRAWRLADYLDQHGRRARRELIPSASFWAAAASHADPAAHASLDNPHFVDGLQGALRAAGASAQAAELIERLPAAGLFQLFSSQEGREERFRFGREADGRPAGRWAWTDLG
jgi:hypothetical protein